MIAGSPLAVKVGPEKARFLASGVGFCRQGARDLWGDSRRVTRVLRGFTVSGGPEARKYGRRFAAKPG